jgi:hypothetical protein
MKLLKKLLLENLSTEEIRQKYYKDISPEIFVRLAKVDPKSKFVDGELIKIGPFVKFIIRDYKNGVFKFEDADRYTEYIDLYFQNRKRKELRGFDVLKINSIYDLIEKLQFLKGEKTGEIYDLLKTIDLGKDYIQLGETENWLIYSPKTEKGACTLGYGTEWCTAWGKMSLDKSKQGRTNMFNSYKNDLIVLVSKETKKPTWQIHLATSQFMDINDRNLKYGPVGGYENIKEFFEKNQNVIYYVFPELKNLNNLNRNNAIELTKYMSLYPEEIIEKIYKSFNEYIPKNIIQGLSKILDDPKLDNIESVMSEIFGKNPITSIWKGVIIDKKFLDDELKSVINIIFSNQYYDADNMLDDEYIEEFMEDVLKKSLSDPNDDITKIIRSLTPLVKNNFDLNDLKILLGNNNYKKLIDEVGYKYNEIDSDANNTAQNNMYNKLNSLFSETYTDDLKFDDVSDFFGLLKGFMITKDYEEGEILDFNDFITEILSSNDIPVDTSDFYDSIMNSASENFDMNSFKDGIHTLIYDALDNHYDEMKEQGITPDKISKLYNILKDLDFNSSTNEIDNEIANIKIFPETADVEKETVKIKFTNKQKPNESYTGVISYDDIAKYATNYQLFENIIRIKKLIFL